MFIELFGVFIIISFGESLVSNSKWNIKCLTFHNRPYQTWPTRVNINSNKVFFIDLLLVLISMLKVVTLLIIHMHELIFQIK